MKRLISLAIFIIFSIQLLCSQTTPYDQKIQEGQELIRNGQYDRAEEVYESAVELAPKRAEAYLGLGYLFSLKQDWREAKDWYGEVLELYPEMIEAHYQQGICDREDGRTRDPVSRHFIWNNSEEHFQKVIQKDSLFKDVFNEYAKLKLYRGDYIDAIQLGYTQVQIKPESRPAKTDIFRYYDFFLNYGDSGLSDPGEQIEWMKQNGTDYDRYFIGEKYRREAKYEVADSILKSLLARPLKISKVPVYLSLVRLHFETGDNETAERYYWTALKTVRNFYELKFIYDDTKYIMSDSDLHRQLRSMNDIRQYYKAFWNRHNPFPGYSYNMRMAEHYRRLIIADKDYRYDGLRLRINSPDRSMVLSYPEIFYKNDRYNDRGLVFIRYGEPDQIANYLGDGAPSNESWLYYDSGLNRKMIFHFEIHPQSNPNDWRLVPVPTDPIMLETRQGWDTRLDQYYMANTELEMQSVLNELQVAAEKNVRINMEKERPFTTRELQVIPLTIRVARFQDELDENFLEIYLSISRKNMLKDNEENKQIEFERGVAVQDSTWDMIFHESKPLLLTSGDTTNFYRGFHIDRYRTYRFGKLLYISGHIKNKQKNQVGGYRFEYKPVPLAKDKLCLSDIVPAYRVEPADAPGAMTHEGLKVVPNPTLRFSREELAYFYYEVYHLTPKEGLAVYEVQQTVRPLDTGKSVFTKFLNLFRGEGETISISKVEQSRASRAQEYTAFDFSRMNTGTVEVEIVVTDKNSGESATMSTTIELY